MRPVAVALAALVVASSVEAQAANPRFGRWKRKSEAPPPASNVMTYEPFGDAG